MDRLPLAERPTQSIAKTSPNGFRAMKLIARTAGDFDRSASRQQVFDMPG